MLIDSPIYQEEIRQISRLFVILATTFLLVPLSIAAWISLRHRISRWGFVLAGLLEAFCVWVMLSLGLSVRLDPAGVSYHYRPFQWEPTTIPWTEIKKAYCRIHAANLEYGDWGIAGTEEDKAYTLPGVVGLQLVLHDGRRVLISITHITEAQQTLKYYRTHYLEKGLEKDSSPKKKGPPLPQAFIHPPLPLWPLPSLLPRATYFATNVQCCPLGSGSQKDSLCKHHSSATAPRHRHKNQKQLTPHPA